MKKEYPSDWDSRRRKVYRRDNHTCQNCGAKGGLNGNAELHAHHVVPKSKGGTHEISNLQTVCNECHKAIHGDSIAPTGQSDSGNPTTVELPDSVALVLFGGTMLSFLLGFFEVIGAGMVLLGTLLAFVSALVLWSHVGDLSDI